MIRPPTMKRLLFALFAAGIVGFFVKPAVVIQNGSETLALFWRFQEGTLHFINSVTDRPVDIHFRITSTFSDFRMVTDELTEQYYTAGGYDVNDRLKPETTSILRSCSIRGIELTIGNHHWHIEGGCLEVRLIWTL
uniref:DUF1850 domain-containing protein n=1 Tax=Desulfatirhabdium butyrativorans TaxID=340467 RepID=A0A7C4RUX6_9BACT